MYRYFCVLFLSLIYFTNVYSQPDYEGFESKRSSYYFGYMSSTITTPKVVFPYPLNINIPSQEYNQDGILFSYTNRLGKVGNAVLSPNDMIEFCFNGGTKLGFGYGEKEIIISTLPLIKKTYKYYFALFDIYSIEFSTDYSHVFDNGSALVLKFAYNFFNIGASASIPDGGSFEDDLIANANLFPLIFKPSIHYDWGKGAIGLTFLIDAGNLLGYGYTKENLYNNDYRGLNSNTMFSKFAVLLTYSL